MYMSHSNDGVIDLTNPMLSHNIVLQVKIFVMWNKWLLNPNYCILIVPRFSFTVNVTKSSSWKRRPSLKP